MSINVTDAAELAKFVKNFTFGFEDYMVFVVMLVISAAIGVYFGFFAGAKDTTDEYLLGGKQMKTWPIAISLVASQLSGISIMTIPAEMYSFGITFGLCEVSMVLVLPILFYLIIPVFYQNNISNCYQYLQMRFNKETRHVVTAAFILTVYLMLPVFIFIPALAFSQVTNINIHLINAVVCSICVFYTMFGGIKAVVWTDVIQAVIMIGSVSLVGIVGINGVGGFGKVLGHARDGGRLTINTDLDPRTRNTLWNCFVGGVCMWTGRIGFNQTCVQRIVALPKLNDARRCLLIFAMGFFVIMFFNCITGIIMYALYHDCDPLTLKLVEKPDKLMPFFVQDIVGHWKGMPGVFISCVFSAALSTMSANLNSLSGIFYFDYVKPFVNHTETKANLIMKLFVLITGIYCCFGGLIVENFKSILQMVITIGGISHGAILGVFMLGLLIPRANGKGALTGLIVSMVGMFLFITGAQNRLKAGLLTYKHLPYRTDGCERFNYTLHNSIFTSTTPHPLDDSANPDNEFSIFDISFHWYTIIGAFIVWTVAIAMSYIWPSEKPVDPKLLSPFMQSFVKYKAVDTDETPMDEKRIQLEMK